MRICQFVWFSLKDIHLCQTVLNIIWIKSQKCKRFCQLYSFVIFAMVSVSCASYSTLAHLLQSKPINKSMDCFGFKEKSRGNYALKNIASTQAKHCPFRSTPLLNLWKTHLGTFRPFSARLELCIYHYIYLISS